MAMHKVKCPDCDWTGKPGAYRWHKQREHGDKASATDEDKRRKKNEATKAWRKKRKHGVAATTVTFCPRCGCNVAAVAAAIALTGG